MELDTQSTMDLYKTAALTEVTGGGSNHCWIDFPANRETITRRGESGVKRCLQKLYVLLTCSLILIRRPTVGIKRCKSLPSTLELVSEWIKDNCTEAAEQTVMTWVTSHLVPSFQRYFRDGLGHFINGKNSFHSGTTAPAQNVLSVWLMTCLDVVWTQKQPDSVGRHSLGLTWVHQIWTCVTQS